LPIRQEAPVYWLHDGTCDTWSQVKRYEARSAGAVSAMLLPPVAPSAPCAGASVHQGVASVVFGSR
jgi:hypothetical protein